MASLNNDVREIQQPDNITEKNLCLVDIFNEFVDDNNNRKSNFGIFEDNLIYTKILVVVSFHSD